MGILDLNNLPTGCGSGSVGNILVNDGSSTKWSAIQPQTSLEVTGTMIVSSDIVMNGSSLIERISLVESLLHIPKRNEELEQKYPDLQDKWELYKTEVESVFPALKKLADDYTDTSRMWENWESLKK